MKSKSLKLLFKNYIADNSAIMDGNDYIVGPDANHELVADTIIALIKLGVQNDAELADCDTSQIEALRPKIMARLAGIASEAEKSDPNAFREVRKKKQRETPAPRKKIKKEIERVPEIDDGRAPPFVGPPAP